MNSRSNWRSLD